MGHAAADADLAWQTAPACQALALPHGDGRARALVYSVHDGWTAPPFLGAPARQLAAAEFAAQRDWGAHRLAEQIASAARLPEVWRLCVARSVFDFGRLRGLTASDADHYARRALTRDMAAALPPDALARVLGLYDAAEADLQARVSAGVDTAPTPLLLLGIHTFDPLGGDGRGGPLRPRPAVSLLHVPERLDAATYGVAFAGALGHTTADPRLVDALAAALADRGLPATRNDPYHLPEGSVELRALARVHADGRLARTPRPSALVLEVRKDLVLDGRDAGAGWTPAPRAALRPAVAQVAAAVAHALRQWRGAASADFSWRC